ncbi:Fic family protein [Puia dinghuensis]|uniref:Fido domain-containing protein n=1 Tax=Puia dinghuensis TaxID=1792502 RepID=A0A8J2UJL1_9BACT|nr:Fic family protein [Puia dinghuensis]GGB25543.1 hypothetical protein GCM10011511_56850 [Puia dinghuensis]
MPTPSEKLADALEELHGLQEKDLVAIKSTEISRVNRELLVKTGYLKEVSKGWYTPSRPDERPGDSTSWYSSYWEFCGRFLEEKYGKDWIVSPEQSVQLHAGNWTVPKQLLIRSLEGSNYNMPLPHDTSLFVMKAALPPAETVEVMRGIRCYTLAGSLIFCSPNTFSLNPIDARTALAMIRDSSEVLHVLLAKGHTTYAGRLAGAFRNIGRDRIAQEIMDAMSAAGYDVREEDPFDTKLNVQLPLRERSPYVNRLRLMWHQMRDVVIPHFPPAPGLPADKEAYLQTMDNLYVNDAYHSLSIERYRVSRELIERVRSGDWDHHKYEEDKRERNAMAARGYWQAFQQVRESVQKILSGDNAGRVADEDHGKWYRQLFEPSVIAGILKPEDLAGYRTHQVYIGGSKHVPINVDALPDVMPVLFELLESEPEASVRAVLGHFVFVFIHPYMDGNGRMGRFLMNVMLASGGYPWTIIPVERREEYMQALEKASVGQDIEPFARFLSFLVEAAIKGTPVIKV